MFKRWRSVRTIGQAWKQSPYYADAEQWTFIFWDEDGPFRRLFERLDLSSTLELACGHGRHAEQMAARASRLTLMDIHENNLEVCRNRLSMHEHVTCIRNNGYDFRPVAERSLTAIFCYDAMVHFSADLVESYLNDVKRVLAPGGSALLHHSNYAAPENRPYGQNPHARNHMTFDLFKTFAASAGLAVEDSEVVDWGGVKSLDRLTLLRA
jgi:SAM-dependent methyltransferase